MGRKLERIYMFSCMFVLFYCNVQCARASWTANDVWLRCTHATWMNSFSVFFLSATHDNCAYELFSSFGAIESVCNVHSKCLSSWHHAAGWQPYTTLTHTHIKTANDMHNMYTIQSEAWRTLCERGFNKTLDECRATVVDFSCVLALTSTEFHSFL